MLLHKLMVVGRVVGDGLIVVAFSIFCQWRLAIGYFDNGYIVLIRSGCLRLRARIVYCHHQWT